MIEDSYVEETIKLAKLLMRFARVNRATYLDINRTPESDTDHTVMLSVIACAVAAQLCPELDLGKVAHYALVHDLVEAYTGDVSTFRYEKVDFSAKEAAEAEAIKKIKKDFGKTFPWIHETIEAFESLKDPEARFVKTLDKSMPTLTILNTDNKQTEEMFDHAEDLERNEKIRSEALRSSYAHDQLIAMEMREKLTNIMIRQHRQRAGS